MSVAACCVPPSCQDTLLTSTAVLAIISAVAGGALCFFEPLSGIGFIMSGGSLGVAFGAMKRLLLAQSLATSAQQLKLENDELRETAERLGCDVEHFRQENQNLSTISDELTSDLEVLKDAIGAVGRDGDRMMVQLRSMWKQYKAENDRHAKLLRGQARMLLLQLVQHFDADSDLHLSDTELNASATYIKASFPQCNFDELLQKARGKGVTLQQLELHLLSSNTQMNQ